MDIKQAVRIVRAKTGLSRDQIAERLGYNSSYLSTALKNPTQNLIDTFKFEFAKELKGEGDIENKTTHIMSGEAGKEISDLKIKSLMHEAAFNVLLPEIANILATLQDKEFSVVYSRLVRARQTEFEELYKAFLKEH